MANRTVKDAITIKGTNPQYLVEKIIRSRVYDSKYWKENCFALTSELLVDKAMELKFVGGVFGANIKPTPFICLVLKMLQIQPEKDIVIEFIKNEDFKYVRALGAYYLRLTGTSLDCYKYLEPLLNDYRKIRTQKRDGNFELSHMDEFIDQCLHDERVCDVQLPRLQKREILEENNELEPRVSLLEGDLLDGEDASSEEEPEAEPVSEKKDREKDREREKDRTRDKDRDRERERDRKRHRSRSRSRERKDRRRDRSQERRSDRSERSDRDKDRRREKDRKEKNEERDRGDRKREKRGGGGDEISVDETNKLRAQLGLPPLK